VFSCCIIGSYDCNSFFHQFLVVKCLNRFFKHCILSNLVRFCFGCIVYIKHNSRVLDIALGLCILCGRVVHKG